MNVFNLPDDIFSDKEQLAGSIVIYHYSSNKDSFREKSILHRNAFSLVISGKKTMHFAEKTVHVQNTEIHMLSAGNCIASVTLSDQKPFESVLVFFDNKVLSEFYAAHPGLIAKLKKSPKEASEPYVEFKKDSFLTHYIHSLLLALQKNARLSEPMKLVKVHELLLYLLENDPATLLSFKHTGSLSGTELHIKNVVEANTANHLTLDELAFLCNMSTSTFKRHFKKIYQSTPTAWFNRQRMILARNMLSEQQEKPGNIWHKLGFETHTGFTKSFKKHFGHLPKSLQEK